jgi:hypothetical protein
VDRFVGFEPTPEGPGRQERRGPSTAQIAAPGDVYYKVRTGVWHETFNELAVEVYVQQVPWSASSVPAGICFARMQAGGETSTAKVTVRK